jgi:hypothetical protein
VKLFTRGAIVVAAALWGAFGLQAPGAPSLARAGGEYARGAGLRRRQLALGRDVVSFD